MIVIGILFLILYAFFNLCLIGSLFNIKKELEILTKNSK